MWIQEKDGEGGACPNIICVKVLECFFGIPTLSNDRILIELPKIAVYSPVHLTI